MILKADLLTNLNLSSINDIKMINKNKKKR